MLRRTRAVLLVAATALLATAAPATAAPATAAPATAAPATAPICRVDYRVTAQWPGGFQAEVSVFNLSGATWPSWRLSFQFTAGQRVLNAWYAVVSQSGPTVTATSAPWASPVRDGGSARFGLIGSWSGSNPPPIGVVVNDGPCDGLSPVVGGNPFAGAAGYVDPDWSARVRTAAAAGGELGPAMSIVAEQPTAVWLDRIAAITAGRGLRGHLDAALAQQAAAGLPVVITLVLYNIPHRSCLKAPLGELDARSTGVAQYRSEYIDPIAAILADPRYRSLRVAVVVEPDSLPGLYVQGAVRTLRCDEYVQAGTYLNTVPYALTKLHEIPNVYAYLDAAQSNLLGWPASLGGPASIDAATDLFRQVADRTPAGVASIDGFAVNVADYDPVDEPLLDVDQTVSGQSIRQSRWVDWNDHIEERTYVDALHAAVVARGFPERVGMLVDTSRNGWGGPNRPTTPTMTTDLNTFVETNRVDRRPARNTWCNQAGAGLGERPRATPLPRVHAYAWVKPPGESDGQYSSPVETVERQCDPNGQMPPIGAANRPTNALPGGTIRGNWFDAAFTQLVRNAYPPLT